jgi:hypothetical protein
VSSAQWVAIKMGRRLRGASVTSRTSFTSRRANQLATCKRQTGAGCSLLPPVRLGPLYRRPILIATNYSYPCGTILRQREDCALSNEMRRGIILVQICQDWSEASLRQMNSAFAFPAVIRLATPTGSKVTVVLPQLRVNGSS